MSLGGWFKDYVYYPITVWKSFKRFNRKNFKQFPKRVARFFSLVFPVMITWVLTGLWHGTGRGYLYWGIYYGTLITISVTFEPEFKSVKERIGIRDDMIAFRIAQMIKVFVIFMGGRLIAHNGTRMVIKMILNNFQVWRYFDQTIYSYGLSQRDFGLIILCIIVLIFVGINQERGSIRDALYKKHPGIQMALIGAAVFSILIFGIYGLGFETSDFIYMQY